MRDHVVHDEADDHDIRLQRPAVVLQPTGFLAGVQTADPGVQDLDARTARSAGKDRLQQLRKRVLKRVLHAERERVTDAQDAEDALRLGAHDVFGVAQPLRVDVEREAVRTLQVLVRKPDPIHALRRRDVVEHQAGGKTGGTCQGVPDHQQQDEQQQAEI